MSDEHDQLLARPYSVGGVEYELWCDHYGRWCLVRDGEDVDTRTLPRWQVDQIAYDVVALRVS